MKAAYRLPLLILMAVAFVLPLSAQDNATPSLGDLARQERARRDQQTTTPAQIEEADAAELSALKPAPFKANILIVESKEEAEKWVLMPAADRPGAARIHQLTREKKYYFPFGVTDYPFPASERMDLSAHVRVLSPTGKIMFGASRFAETIGADPRSPSVIIMNPVMDITFESTDPAGTYTVMVTISDHVHSTYSKAVEQFQLVPATGTESKAGN